MPTISFCTNCNPGFITLVPAQRRRAACFSPNAEATYRNILMLDDPDSPAFPVASRRSELTYPHNLSTGSLQNGISNMRAHRLESAMDHQGLGYPQGSDASEACMTTCPSGVNYMHLVDHARAYIEDTDSP